MELTAKHREVIVKTWLLRGRAPVNAIILSRIQRALAKRFGKDTAVSPASIARVLADEGAELRHPDVIDCDVRWREKIFRQSALAADDRTRPLTLRRAEALLKRFENLRQKLTVRKDTENLRRLRDRAINEKAKAQLLARDRSLSDALREAQEEIAEWIRVWLETPEILNDWLELRQRSAEFREKFATETQHQRKPE